MKKKVGPRSLKEEIGQSSFFFRSFFLSFFFFLLTVPSELSSYCKLEN